MREIGFQRTYIFKIFRGSMPPDPPRKVRLWRTITFSITYKHPLENLSYAPALGCFGKLFLFFQHLQITMPMPREGHKQAVLRKNVLKK